MIKDVSFIVDMVSDVIKHAVSGTIKHGKSSSPDSGPISMTRLSSGDLRVVIDQKETFVLELDGVEGGKPCYTLYKDSCAHMDVEFEPETKMWHLWEGRRGRRRSVTQATDAAARPTSYRTYVSEQSCEESRYPPSTG